MKEGSIQKYTPEEITEISEHRRRHDNNLEWNGARREGGFLRVPGEQIRRAKLEMSKVMKERQGLTEYTPEETEDLSRKREIVNSYLIKGGAFFVETGRLHVADRHIRDAKGEMKRAKLQHAQTSSEK